MLNQSVSTDQPTYVTSDLNGQPAVRFNGYSANQSLNNSVPNYLTNLSMIVVSNTHQPCGNPVRLLFGANGQVAGLRTFGYSSSAEGFFSYADNLTGRQPRLPMHLQLRATRFSLGTGNSQTVTFIKGGNPGTPMALTGLATLSAGTSIGAASDGSNPWQGDIAEVLIYDHALSSSEIYNVGTYLSTKYGLTAPTNPNVTPTPTHTPSPTPTGSLTPTPTPSPSPTPTPTTAPTPTPTHTPSPTPTPSPTHTPSPTPTLLPTAPPPAQVPSITITSGASQTVSGVLLRLNQSR